MDDDDNDLIYIKHLPMGKLLWALWSNAKLDRYMQLCPELAPELTQAQAWRDINFMLMDQRPIALTTYYGRLLFVDITNDYLDVFTYDMYNGSGMAKKITNKLKLEELLRSMCKYYTFH